MDLTYTAEQDAFRAEARVARRARPTSRCPRRHRGGLRAPPRWERRSTTAAGEVPWPVEYGGRGADLIEWLIFEEEY